MVKSDVFEQNLEKTGKLRYLPQKNGFFGFFAEYISKRIVKFSTFMKEKFYRTTFL
jgi:hypothetical protein